MNLGTVFKLSLYGLTALVGVILGAAEGEGSASGHARNELVLPFLSLPVVVCGFFFTERRRAGSSTRGTGLNPWWANALGVIALIATGYEFFFSKNREGKLLAGTHLLLYATWIVLFQQKTVRLYWFVMALGILQLALASVLTTKGWFGFCAVAYMFSAVWTLSLFSLWRAEQLFEEEERRRLAEAGARTEAAPLSPPSGIQTRSGIQPRSAIQPRPGIQQSEVRSAVQHEDGTQWLTVRFVTGVLMTTCSALVVSAAFFMFIPRMWVGAEISVQGEGDSSSPLARRTGLATSVRLGDLGPILESTEPVFEIRMTNLKTGEPIPAQEYADRLGLAEPLFRGAVLTSYGRSRWSADIPAHLSLNNRIFERPTVNVDVLQEIRLFPTNNDILFCLGPPIAMSDAKHNPVGEIDEISGIVSRGERRNDNAVFEYDAFTVLPSRPPLNYKLKVSARMRRVYERFEYKELNLKLPPGLGRLKELTREILEKEIERLRKAEARQTARPLTPSEIASAIESHLRDSGQYQYSLDLSIEDPNVDPVEDFLFNRRAGHCEYFATALVLMLRSAKVPARIVSGYKGGIPHSGRRDFLEIQQKFAHLWVEAWVDGDGWTTFDATPADARSLSIASVTAKKTSLWAGVQTTLSGLWNQNVLNMTLDRQEESIYKPIRELAYSLATFTQQLITSPRAAVETLWAVLTDRQRWFSVGGAIFAVTFVILVFGAIWLSRWMASRFRAWVSTLIDCRSRPNRRVIEFYDRFVRLMRARGLQRRPTQTQSEFADQVASAFSPELRAAGLDDTPGLISRLFYQVRFGDQDLSTADLGQMEEMLNSLEQALSNDTDRHASPHPAT